MTVMTLGCRSAGCVSTLSSWDVRIAEPLICLCCDVVDVVLEGYV